MWCNNTDAEGLWGLLGLLLSPVPSSTCSMQTILLGQQCYLLGASQPERWALSQGERPALGLTGQGSQGHL